MAFQAARAGKRYAIRNAWAKRAASISPRTRWCARAPLYHPARFVSLPLQGGPHRSLSSNNRAHAWWRGVV